MMQMINISATDLWVCAKRQKNVKEIECRLSLAGGKYFAEWINE